MVTNLNAQKVGGATLDTTVTLGTSDILVSSQNAVKSYVDTSISAITTLPNYNAIPIGTILMWPTASAPTGFLMCTGGSYTRSGTTTGCFPKLFALIGTSYGIGNSVDGTTFTVPNFSGRSPVGAGTSVATTILQDSTDTTPHTPETWALAKNKNDIFMDHTHSTGVQASESSYNSSGWTMIYTSDDGGHHEYFQSGGATGSVGPVTHGKGLGINFIIKHGESHN
jgi:microcystin-dependent protein